MLYLPSSKLSPQLITMTKFSDLNKRLLKQILFCIAYIQVGISIMVRGTCFKDLMEHYETSTSTLSYCLATSALGVMLSSYLGGHLQQHWPHYGFLETSAFLFLASLSTALQAHAGSIWGFLIVSLSLGLGLGGILAIVRNQCLVTWRGTKFGPGPFMQCLFLSQGTGFIISSMVAKPFLSIDHFPAKNGTLSQNAEENDSRLASITLLFPLLGAISTLVAIIFFTIGLKDELFWKGPKSNLKEGTVLTSTGLDKVEDKFSWQKSLLTATMIFCFFANQSLVTSVSNYLIPTLDLEHTHNLTLSISRQEGATTQAIFFSGAFVGRILSAIALLKMSASQNILANLTIALLATFALIICKENLSPLLLQLFYGLFGLGLAPIVPGVLLWLEQFFVLQGRTVGLTAVSSAAGMLATLFGLGTLIDLVPGLLFHYQFCVVALSMLMLSLGTVLGKSVQKDGKDKDIPLKECLGNGA